MSLCRVAILCFLSLFISLPAFAGAWPREEGATFVAIQLRSGVDDLDREPVGSAYLEYGLRRDLTVGAKVEYDFTQKEVIHTELFGRWHLTESSFPLRAALGLAVEGFEGKERLSPSLHLGQGFDTQLGPGWADVALSVDTPFDQWAPRFSAFAQLGMKPHEQWMTMLSLNVERLDGETQLKALPAIAWEISDGQHLNVEYSHVVEGIARSEVSLGLWLEF